MFRKSYASSARLLRYGHERACLLAKGEPARPAKPVPDGIDMPYSGNRLHPTQKPVEALAPLIEAFTRPGDLGPGPFSGGGSILAAAQRLGRDCFGVELDNGHHHTGCQRLARLRVRDASVRSQPPVSAASRVLCRRREPSFKLVHELRAR